jgi:hypothetical protein
VARSPAWTRGEKRRGACDACVTVGGEQGGKRRERGCGGRLLLKRRRGRQGRGGGPGCGAMWRRKWGRERGLWFGDVDRHDIDVVALGCSDSGGLTS